MIFNHSIKKKLSYVFLLFNFLSVIGCSNSKNNTSLNTTISIPKIIELDRSQCPIIDGVYYSAGTSNSNFSDFYKNPILEKNYAGLNSIASRKNIVKIEFDKNSFEMRLTIFEPLPKNQWIKPGSGKPPMV